MSSLPEFLTQNPMDYQAPLPAPLMAQPPPDPALQPIPVQIPPAPTISMPKPAVASAAPKAPKAPSPEDVLTGKLTDAANNEADTALGDMAHQRERLAAQQPDMDAAAARYKQFLTDNPPPMPHMLKQSAPVYSDFAQQVSPWAILAMTLGGKAMKLSGSNILGAVTGMVEGTNEGNMVKYQSAFKAYKANQEAIADEAANMNAYYSKMMEHQKDIFGADQLVSKNALDLIGVDQKNLTNALAVRQALDKTAQNLAMQQLKLEQIHMKAMEKSAGGLAPDDIEALFGKDGAVTTGKLSPDKINSRTAPIYAAAFRKNPNVDMNALATDASIMRNPTYINRALTLETLPEVLTNMVAAGKRVNYSDAKFVGEAEKFFKGQSNDPDFINYMTQRNDALLTVAATMRGVGMSDQAHQAEIEAATPTLSPRALDAWLNAQQTALIPRLKIATQFTRGKTPDAANDLLRNGPTGVAAAGSVPTFATEAEATASGAKGDVMIGGRRARIN